MWLGRRPSSGPGISAYVIPLPMTFPRIPAAFLPHAQNLSKSSNTATGANLTVLSEGNILGAQEHWVFCGKCWKFVLFSLPLRKATECKKDTAIPEMFAPFLFGDSKAMSPGVVFRWCHVSVEEYLLSVADQNHQDGGNTAQDNDEGEGQQGPFRVAQTFSSLFNAGHCLWGPDLQNASSFPVMRLEVFIDIKQFAI